VEEKTVLPRWLGLDLRADLGGAAFLQAQLPLLQDSADVLVSASTLSVETQLDGELNVRGEDGALALEGEVSPVRGTALVFGRPFAIEQGSTVAFTGGDYTNPVLDIRAEYDADAYGTIDVTITGTPDALNIDFKSDQYPSTDDIFAILLLGTPTSEMETGGGESSVLWEMASAFLRGQAEEAGNTVRVVDMIQFESESLRVGKQLGNGVFLVMDWNFLADDDEESIYTATIEVRLSNTMQLEGSYGTAGESEVGFVWKIRW
jgi:autotransporter translocation and assembly factor TamB